MSIELKMPALSPTMEEGTLARWLVKPGDAIRAGDLIAEIETDKAMMEFEAVDEGVIREILVTEGMDGVAVGTVIALVGEEKTAPADAPATDTAPVADPLPPPSERKGGSGTMAESELPTASVPAPIRRLPADRIKVGPLAARIAEAKNIALSGLMGSGPNGRIVRADLGLAPPPAASPPAAMPVARSGATATAKYVAAPEGVTAETVTLSAMRKTIARRLTESKQQVPNIYLTVDVRLDALLALRAQLNRDLTNCEIKLSVNDMIIRAQALAPNECPGANVQFGGDVLHRFSRVDISVAVSIPGGLITPIVRFADSKSLSAVARAMKDFAARACVGKLEPHEYLGGIASLSNLGMFGVRQFEAVINPPQARILPVGQSEQRMIVADGQPAIATMMSGTGSFDQRAIVAQTQHASCRYSNRWPKAR